MYIYELLSDYFSMFLRVCILYICFFFVSVYLYSTVLAMIGGNKDIYIVGSSQICLESAISRLLGVGSSQICLKSAISRLLGVGSSQIYLESAPRSRF